MSMSLKDISNQVISMDKEYVTRDGRKVRILCADNYRNTEYPVVAIMPNGDVLLFTKNGKYSEGVTSSLDLIEVTKIEEGLKQHDLVMVSDVYDKGNLRFFSHYEDGKAFSFNSGACEGYTTPWDYCRKATPQEIVANKRSLN